MFKRMGFVSGLALGAGFMYLLDPNSGRRRRALMRDQMVSARHGLEDTATTKSEFVKDKAYGVVAEARSAIKQEDVDDHTLEDRVRSELGHVTNHTGTIHVSAVDGKVTLHGSLPSNEMIEVVRTAERVRGVKSVDNRLQSQEHMAEGR